MASTHRQASRDPEARRRGRYGKQVKKPGAAAQPEVKKRRPAWAVSEAEQAEWIEHWVAVSTLEDKLTARTHAEALAYCRRFILESIRKRGALPDVLTDGQSRTMNRALREQVILSAKLGVDAQLKRKKKRTEESAWGAGPPETPPPEGSG